MKKSFLFALILTFSWSINFANNGEDTTAKNTKEDTTNTLIGNWDFTNMSYEVADNVHYCGDLIIADDAFLKFSFELNGSYSKTYGTGESETIEKGTWEVTADSSSLVLFPNDGTSAQFIKIVKMEEEKVELQLDINSAGLEGLFCEKINVLKFSKNILPLRDSVIR